MLRKLGNFERALLITSRHAPFNIVSVLQMENAPIPDTLRKALEILQKRQPLLCASIQDGKGKPFFEDLPSAKLPFTLIERTDKNQWQNLVEQEMNFHYNHEKGPLFRVVYLYKDGFGDLILNVHHTIMDAVSGMNLLDELLQLCAGEIAELPRVELAPAMETVYPSPYKGFSKIFKLANYALAQMGEMAQFMWRTRGKRVPAVKFGGKGKMATLTLPENLVDALARQGRKKGITLNSILNTALMQATNRHLYRGESLPMQTFAFANLRSSTIPPIDAKSLANYISMLRFTQDISGDASFWILAEELNEKIYYVLKKGDKFNAATMSEPLMKMFIAMKSMRMGATALSYTGAVPLKTQYGKIKPLGIHGIVSAYDLGPELSSQARLFNNELLWDFIYLDSDMDRATVEKIIAEIKLVLEKASQKQG